MFINRYSPNLRFISDSATQNILEQRVIREATKCSLMEISEVPVNLEPPWENYAIDIRRLLPNELRTIISADPIELHEGQYSCIELWYRNVDKIDPKLTRIDFFSTLYNTGNVSYELIANQGKIKEQLVLPNESLHLVLNSIETKIQWVITKKSQDCCYEIVNQLKNSSTVYLLDIVPPPPYFLNLRTTTDFPLNTLYTFFHRLTVQTDAFIMLQLMFRPVIHDWLTNMKRLAASILEINNLSHNLLMDSLNEEVIKSNLREKLNYGNKFYAVSARILALIPQSIEGKSKFEDLKSLFMGIYTYGDYHFNTLTYENYIQSLSSKQKIIDSFLTRTVHRSGFLLNPAEMAMFCNFVSIDVYNQQGKTYGLNITAGAAPSLILTKPDGLLLGETSWLGDRIFITQPGTLLNLPLLCLGPTGSGKTYGECKYLLWLIKNGYCVIVLDPHNTLSSWLLERIPINFRAKTVLFSLTIPNYIPGYNLIGRGIDPSVITNYLISTLRSYFNTSWGTNIEHIYRHGIYSLAVLNIKYPEENLSISDLLVLFSRTDRGKYLRDKIIPVTDNSESRRFWTEEFNSYNVKEFRRVVNKFSELFLNKNINKLFTQTKSKITVQDVIENKKILLINLPPDDDLTTELAAACLIEDISNTVKSQDVNSRRNLIFLCIDETEIFKNNKLLYQLPLEMRKFGLVPHYIMHSIDLEMRDILNNFGTIIRFGAEIKNNNNLIQQFSEIIANKEYLNIGIPGKAVAFFAGGYVINISTGQLAPPLNDRNDMLKESLNKYYTEIENIAHQGKFNQEKTDFSSWRKDLN